MFVDVLYWDATCGLTNEPWDIVLDNEETIVNAITQARLNNKNLFTLIAIVTAKQVPIFLHALEVLGFQDVDLLYWMKMTVNSGYQIPPNQRTVAATETIITARSTFHGRHTALTPAAFERDPADIKAKYNFFIGPDEMTKLKRPEGGIANVYQKPTWLSSYLTKPYVLPGSNVVVFGAGVGGDVMGLLDIKCNVLAIEKDTVMYGRLVGNMRNYEPRTETYNGITMSELYNLIYEHAKPEFEDIDREGNED